MTPTKLKGGEQIFCHPPDRCAGHACSVHSPSDHHMRDWPQHWRDDAQKMERMCPHGIGHPDPDDLAYQKQVNPENAHGIHGCDGCCEPIEGEVCQKHEIESCPNCHSN